MDNGEPCVPTIVADGVVGGVANVTDVNGPCTVAAIPAGATAETVIVMTFDIVLPVSPLVAEMVAENEPEL
jgi:hypothetical protein